MAEKITPVGEAPPKPKKVRDEAALRWPSAATSAGGAYIPSHCDDSKHGAQDGKKGA